MCISTYKSHALITGSKRSENREDIKMSKVLNLSRGNSHKKNVMEDKLKAIIKHLLSL